MWRFIRQYPVCQWPFYLAGLCALLITNYVTTLIPLQIKTIIDLLNSGMGTRLSLKPEIVLLIFLALGLAVFRTASRILIFIPGRMVEYRLRNDVFEKLLTLSASFFRRQKTGDIMSRLINDIQSLRLMSALGFLHIVNTVLIYGFVLVQMMKIDWWLTIMTLLPVPIVMLAVRLFVAKLYVYNTLAQRQLGGITDFFVESLGNIQLIKSYQAESTLRARLDEENQSLKEVNVRLASVRATMFPFIAVIGSIGQLILFFLGGKSIITGTLTLGEFVAMSGYLMLLAWPTVSMAWIINIIQRGSIALSRIQDILIEEPQIQDGEAVSEFASLTSPPTISLDQLSFSYEGEKVLDNITLEIPAGSSLGVFGPTGSGKTTLAQVLARVEAAEEGMYQLNGNNVEIYPLKTLRQAISYVPQVPFLFSMSILENIIFASELDSDNNEAKNIASDMAKLASVEQDILSFPNQFQTLIGEKGIILSGGQKSRMSLARAYAKPHQLLILDDVLSAVDNVTESRLIAEIEAQSQRPTSIIISHRISALSFCDEIVVLEQGRIVGKGTHEELINTPGLYRETWLYQKMESEL